MDKNFLAMIKLFVYGSTGIEQEMSYDFDYKKIMKYAEEQGIWQIVFVAIQKLCKESKIQVDELWYEATNMQVIMSCLDNSASLEKSHKIMAELNGAGIKNCIVKGEALARLYYKPECRVSGDIDIYIGDGDDKSACEILYNHGYTVEPKTDNSNHYNCMHPEFGELELHTTLYDKIMHSLWFENINMVEEQYINCGNYHTLGYTDGGLYVALHAIKHFLSAGFGLRHIMDLLLYLENYYDKMNTERFFGILKQLKYFHLVEVMAGIGKEYFGIECRFDASYTKAEVDRVIEETFNTGLFGHKQNGVNTFGIYTNMIIASRTDQKPEKVMGKWRRKNAIKALSFAPSQMYRHYPYSQKNKWLLPVAWCNHIGYILKTVFTRVALVKEILNYKTPKIDEETNKKINLLKELDII